MFPEEIEQYRDRLWRREEALRIKTVEDLEAMVEELGFCLAMTDIRKRMPSVYIAVCGRRDAHMPRNVQKDEEASAAWVLKDQAIARGRIYYAKLFKGHSMFISRDLVPVFNSIWGCSRRGEKGILSGNASAVLALLRKEWEMATADIKKFAGVENKTMLSKALDELQQRMKVIPSEVVYIPKFTYIWTPSETRFSEQLRTKIPREEAVYKLARAYLKTFGLTLRGEFSGKFGLSRAEAGRAFHRLVDEGFAIRIDTGIYRLNNV
ncbi:MAG: DNA glycosylase AlkZ-like family protein [Pyrinomonadaceae bacterium]|jgi:hypothetical protein